jgi:4-hydroxy 2-oxovalerate aldolase
VTGYSDPELLEIINKINEIGPYGVAIVDTYGLMHKKELLHYFDMMDKNLSKGIVLGYHAHNNFQLAYANAIELMGMTSDRELLIDGSLYGMGKGAGNANTELLALYLNENFGNNYDIDQLLEAIDVDISKEYSKKYWGYSLMHYIAASNDCHPDYVNSLINKKTLSVKSINEILSKLDVQKKLSFNKELIESMYIQYHTGTIDDNDAYKKLGDELKGKKILVLAPGKTIESHRLEIDSFIKENNPVIISINFLSEVFRSDFVFMGNAKRYSQFFNEIYKNGSKIKTICTSNVEEANKKIDYTLNIKSLINEDTLIRDNPMLMLLNALIKMDIKEVSIAGFDGYSKNNESNYFREYIQFLYCNDDVVLRNDAVKKALAGMKGLIALNYLTPSNYL